jgi:hypothetical protein
LISTLYGDTSPGDADSTNECQSHATPRYDTIPYQQMLNNTITDTKVI